MALPTNPTRVVRKIGTIPYAAGQRPTLEIDKDGVLFSLQLKLTATISAGATPGTGPTIYGLSRLLRRVEIVAGGRDTVQSVPGYMLAARNHIEYGRPPYGIAQTDADRVQDMTIAANGSKTYTIVLPVYFCLPLGRRMDDTGLDTFGLSQLTLAVTWGDASDLYKTAGTATVSGVTLEVEGDYLINPTRAKPYLVRTLDYQDVDITATNNEMAITIDSRTGLVIASIMAMATEDWVGSDNIVKALRLQAGSFVFSNRDAVQLRADNQRSYNTVPGAGVLYIDPRSDGQLNTTILTSPNVMAAELKLMADVVKQSGSTRLSVQREGIRTLLV